jgi:hypothetical protein
VRGPQVATPDHRDLHLLFPFIYMDKPKATFMRKGIKERPPAPTLT